MNVGLITTFVIGGLFLISILTFNQQVLTNSQEVTLNSVSQNSLNDVVTVISNDFNRIGFNSGTANPFTKIDSDDIIFLSDAHDNDNYGVTNIRWYLDTNDPVSATSNPNDYYLKRVGPITASTYGTLKYPVTFFEIKYYTASGTVTSNTSTVKKIEVEIMVESGEAFRINTDNYDYPKSVWKRIFVPNNINLPY